MTSNLLPFTAEIFFPSSFKSHDLKFLTQFIVTNENYMNKYFRKVLNQSYIRYLYLEAFPTIKEVNSMIKIIKTLKTEKLIIKHSLIDIFPEKIIDTKFLMRILALKLCKNYSISNCNIIEFANQC